MRDYFIRRLLLIPPTLLGVTIIVFIITRFVPGGPLARALTEAVSHSIDSLVHGNDQRREGDLTRTPYQP